MPWRLGQALAALILAGGCTLTGHSEGSLTAKPPAAVSAEVAAGGTSPGGMNPATGPGEVAADPRQMQEVMAQVEAVGRMDPGAQADLLSSLRQTTPDLWPLVAQQFRAALAYRIEAERREGASLEATRVASTDRWPLAGGPVPAGSRGAAAPVAPPAPVSPTSGGQHLSARVTARDDRAGGGASVATPVASPGPGRPGPAAGGGRPAGSATAAGSGQVLQPTQQGGAGGGLPGVVAAAYRDRVAERGGGDWRKLIEEAIGAFESEGGDLPQSEDAVAEAVRLRLLRLLADRREEALEPVPGLDPLLQDFWSKELFGLGTLLDTRGITDAAIRTVEARRHLADAVVSLAESAPLVVRNLAFVTRVDSFGTFTPFEKYEFRPGQEVILYAEVENFKSTTTAQGFHTALKSSYQIFDSRGQRVADHESATNEEYCHNRRRDFFIGYEFPMPQRIYPGRYVLQLTVADLNSQKIGQSSIEFTIADSDQ